MIINTVSCLCDECARSGYCDDQRVVIELQRVIARLRPDSVTITVYIDDCPSFQQIAVQMRRRPVRADDVEKDDGI